MHPIVILILAMATAYAINEYEPPADSKVLLRVVQAIEDSKIEDLTSGRSPNGGYQHLKEADYLGFIDRDGKRFTIAYVVYTFPPTPASETGGSPLPELRYDFILILDPTFKIVSHRHCGVRQLRQQGEQLISGESVIVDFSKTDDTTRHSGFQIGNTLLYLPYPFADRISEEDWKSRAFRKNGSVSRPTASKEAEAGAGQPATQPADKPTVNDQPSTPTPVSPR
jgi:hypothetical protein